MIDDAKQAAAAHEVAVFVVDKKIESFFSQKIHLFVTSNANQTLMQKSSLKAGSFKSVFLGKVQVDVSSFDQLGNIKNVRDFYLIGTKDNCIAFKQELINTYAGRFPSTPPKFQESTWLIIGIWLVVFALLILLTVYEIAFMKKKNMLQVMMGDHMHLLVAQQVITDLVFYVVLFGGSMFFLQPFTNVFYQSALTLACMVTFLLINSLCYLLMYRVDYKKDIATVASDKKALMASYVIKTLSMMIVMVVMAGSIHYIYEGVQFYRQATFFKAHPNHNYFMLASDDVEDTLANDSCINRH